jgi:hypothetical protein
MKNSMLVFMAGLTLVLCESVAVVGQTSARSGMFGSRVLGQSLAPNPRSFGGGNQTTPSGNFLYLGRLNGGTDFTTPWWPLYPGMGAQAAGASPVVQPTLQSQRPASPVQVAPPSQSPAPGYNPLTPSAEQGASTALGMGTTPAWSLAGARDGTRAASASAARAEPYTRSPELSDRLTRIARTRGMLAAQAIDVCLSGNVALVQGAVRTQADRVLLGNVVGLEPDVSQIDNRLIVTGSGGLSSNAPAGR